ncbi:very short patch repair endonuclease [Microvirga sp. 2TAF3]|uniref:very short patch repair endonuclease n=1 Tax=Microvirga sp. 2TAF3 TaxID=3233014 RepID=UPI003F9A0FF0
MTDKKLESDRQGKQRFADVPEGRRRNMQANKGKDTKPEVAVRRMLHALGYRFRLHRKDLPGRPDIVLSSRRKVIEVRGCFWHGHGCHPLGLMPKTRREYWEPKITGNKTRDARNVAALREQGWDVLELWECRIRAEPDLIREELIAFLGPARRPRQNS